jgi:hypothetical protein
MEWVIVEEIAVVVSVAGNLPGTNLEDTLD